MWKRTTAIIAAMFVAVLALPAPTTAQVTPPRARLLHRDEMTPANPFPGVYSTRIYTDTVWITIVTMAAGARSAQHNHPDEQTMLFRTGQVKAFVGGETFNVGPGDILIIPSYIPHHFEALQDAAWTEVHGPGFNNGPKWQ